MIATPIYAALLTLLYITLSFRVIGRRRSAKVSLGDGGDSVLNRRLRAHGNFAEYVPLGLLLMVLVELQDGAALLIHAIGLMLLIGRVAHARGLAGEPENFRYRKIGMQLTFTALLAGAVGNLILVGMNFLATSG